MNKVKEKNPQKKEHSEEKLKRETIVLRGKKVEVGGAKKRMEKKWKMEEKRK